MFRYPKRARWMVYNGKAEPKKKDDFGGSPHLGNLIYDTYIYTYVNIWYNTPISITMIFHSIPYSDYLKLADGNYSLLWKITIFER